MSRKKKEPVEISPLKSYEVGRIKENKFWYIKLLLFFGFFVAIIFFLPQLSSLYDKIIRGSAMPSSNTSISNNVVTNNTTEEENTIIDETKNYFNEEKEITVNNITFSAINLSNNTISFSAKNIGTNAVDLEQLNLYFEVYNNTDNLLKRIAVLGNVKANEVTNVSFDFEGEAEYFEIKEILEEDYTYIDLSIDDNNISILTCVKGEEKVVYTFNNEKLTKIKHTDNIITSSSNYTERYDYYKKIYDNNRSKPGITTSFTTEDNLLSFKLIIDYSKNASISDNRLYVAKDTAPRIVNFKVESWEYECS